MKNLRLPKGLFAVGGKIWVRYYHPKKHRTWEESTGLSLSPVNIKEARLIRENLIKQAKYRTVVLLQQQISIEYGLSVFLQKKKTLKPKTISVYKEAVKYIAGALGENFIIGDVSESEWQKVEDFWTNKLSQNSRSIYSRSLRTLFGFFIQQKWIETNPVKKTPLLRKPPKAIQAKDFEEIMSYLRQNNLEAFYIIRFLYLTGLRIGEAVKITWQDIDLEKNLMRFWNEKSNRHDFVPILQPAVELLKEIRKTVGMRPKIFSYDCTSLTIFYRTQARLWAQPDHSGKKPKMLRRYNIHQLRKTFISTLIANGVSREDARILARHRDHRTTEQHYIEHDLQQMANRVNSQISFLPY